MKPLLKTVVAISLLLIVHAHPENIEDVKELPQSKELAVEAEESEPQARVERCTTCGTGNLKSPQALFADLQAVPGAEVHTQQSFEGCSSEKGCAGLKIKDGKVVERYGNADAYNAAASANSNNEFKFYSGLAKNVFEGTLPGNGPHWWMNQDSPFKGGAASSGKFEKFSKSSSSSYSSTGSSGAGANSALNLAGNPFLNGDLATLAAEQNVGVIKPSNFQSSSYESSSFSASNKGKVDLSNNPFLNGGFKAGQTGFGFGATAGFDAANSQSYNANANAQSFGNSYSGGFASGNKVSTGYASLTPQIATSVSNVNQIQGEKANEFDYQQQTQQSQQNFNTAFQSSGSVSGSGLQQTCATEGYSCVIKSQCNNGVAYLRSNPRKQYCNVDTEICCKVEIFQVTNQEAGSTLNQGSSYAGQNNYASQTGSAFGIQGQSTQTGFASNVGSSSYGAKGTYGAQSGTSFVSANRGTVGSTGFGSTFVPSQSGSAFGVQGQTTQTGFGKNVGSSSYGAQGTYGAQSGTGAGSSLGSTNRGTVGSTGFGSTFAPSQSGLAFGVQGQTTQTGFGKNVGSSSYGAQGTYGAQSGTGAGSSFGSTNRGTVGSTGFGSTFAPSQSGLAFGVQGQSTQTGFGTNVGSSSYGAKGTYGAQSGTAVGSSLGSTNRGTVGSTGLGSNIGQSTQQYGSTNGFKATGQNSFFGTDSSLAGSVNPGVYRPGAIGSNLKPGIPYLPPVDNDKSDTFVSSTIYPTPTFATTPRPVRPTTAKPTYLPPPVSSTSAPGYLPPIGEPSNNKETIVPNPIDTEGFLNLGPYQEQINPIPINIPVGCAAALKCTPIEFCTADGVISNTSVVLTKQQNVYRVPLTDCKDIETGRIGKCCRDPYYTDPWPANQLGKWSPGIFEPKSTVRTPTTGTLNKYVYSTTKPTPFATPRSTPVYQTSTSNPNTEYEIERNQRITGEKGSIIVLEKQKNYTPDIRKDIGIYKQVNQTEDTKIKEIGMEEINIFQNSIDKFENTLQNEKVNLGHDNEISESIQRVFLTPYTGDGKCGVLNGQRPYGDRNKLEVDFAEIPWQAMVLLQTNKSLLCGGVITRPDVVVTSAACVDGLDAKNVLIKGGEWKLGIDDEPLPFQIVQVKTILLHPLYVRGSAAYDSAILVLAENLRFAKNINPICLPRAEETIEEYYNGIGYCIVTGWGKDVLQAHLSGSIMHSVNVSLLRPGECQAKLSSNYPNLIDKYDKDSCVCGQPSNPLNDICKVDVGSALACTGGDGQYVFRGVYSWDSGCETGNQIAAFYRFDLEWYQWAIGIIESAKFTQYTIITNVIITDGVKYVYGFNTISLRRRGIEINIKYIEPIVKNYTITQTVIKKEPEILKIITNKGSIPKIIESYHTNPSFISYKTKPEIGIYTTKPEVYSYTTKPEVNSYTTKPEIITYTTKPKVFSYTTKPEIVTYTTKPKVFSYTTKPEIITYTTKPKVFSYTTKPEIFTYTTKPKVFSYTTKPEIFTYTTKPQLINYETSGSRTDPQYIAPAVSSNPSFEELVGKHEHTPNCKCLEGKK
ncbi:uncharacterized protein LOC126778781 isoform X2 [Nymphalis io]|uniref:uncharacterized protein LOC126778781 isoform X2 n=1 Tax=Inachis io TaxID=171585 RepID=UPI00216896BB|nr:uncharacterized protein LOC126778781 isoform X2 [Nymphalis io]